MMEILEMSHHEIDDLLARSRYGHLACSQNDQPYVVPIYFAYDKPDIYVYTTAGLKSEMIARNPKICLQVEEIDDHGAWRSLVLTGQAEQITEPVERERAIGIIRSENPTLLPALAIKWANDWMRKNIEVVYRIKITTSTGRLSSDIKIATAGAHAQRP
jgi:uncharacterized protein